MYRCIYVHVYNIMCMYMHMYVHIYVCTCMHVCMYVHMHVCMIVCIEHVQVTSRVQRLTQTCGKRPWHLYGGEKNVECFIHNKVFALLLW